MIKQTEIGGIIKENIYYYTYWPQKIHYNKSKFISALFTGFMTEQKNH